MTIESIGFFGALLLAVILILYGFYRSVRPSTPKEKEEENRRSWED